MSNKVQGLTLCFNPVDPSHEVEVVHVEDGEYTLDVTVTNATVTPASTKKLTAFFGGLPTRVRPVEMTQNLLVSVSKIKTEGLVYSLADIAKYLQESSQKGLFLGIGPFGPEFLPLEKLTHGSIHGATGMGKSHLFRSLLGQLLSFNDDVIVDAIDPKGNDLQVYQSHPRVGFIAHTKSEIHSLIQVYLLELAYRKKVYREAFSTPPTTLAEYHEMRIRYGRTDLPDLSRRVLFIEEAHAALKDSYHTTNGIEDGVDYLVRQSRAFGMHLLFSTRKPGDLGSMRTQLSHVFTYYLPDGGIHYLDDGTDTISEIRKEMRAVAGRLAVINRVDREFTFVQSPVAPPDTCLSLAFGFNPESRFKNKGICRFAIREELLQMSISGRQLIAGVGLSDLQLPLHRSSAYPLYEFAYPEVYDVMKAPLDTEEVDSESERDSLAEFKTALERLGN